MSYDPGGVRALLSRLREQDAQKEQPREPPSESIRRRWVRPENKGGAVWSAAGVHSAAQDTTKATTSEHLSREQIKAIIDKLAQQSQFRAELRMVRSI